MGDSSRLVCYIFQGGLWGSCGSSSFFFLFLHCLFSFFLSVIPSSLYANATIAVFSMSPVEAADSMY